MPGQDYRLTNIRASAVLTTSYVTATVLKDDIWRFNQLIIFWNLTLGSLTSGELRVEFSLDGSTWFQKSFISPVSSSQLSVTAGDYTATVGGTYPMEFNIAYNFIRVAAKGTGTVTGSLCKLDAALIKT